MPGNLPLGSRKLLVAFDRTHQIRDLYYLHVGQENHALGHPFRTGIWVSGQFRWLEYARWENDEAANGYTPSSFGIDGCLVIL
jgi:glucoamylase